MAKSLIIVESPTKAKTITKYLGRGYTVMASVGHIKDLPTSKLGVDLEHNFKPQYVTIKGKSKVLADIKKKAEESDKVFLAPDPDREGEAIAWHLAEELRGKSKKKSDGKVFRVLFNEITERAIKQALQSPGQIDMKLVNAQQAQHRGVEVVDVDAALGDVVTEIVRLAIDQTRLHATAGHPRREATRMMVAPIIVRREFAL